MAIAVSIVEDDTGLRESICRFIQGAPGFQCLGAYASAEEALTEVPGRPPAVVLMDINLPKMSGIECVRHLKEKLPDLQIIMLTVYENSDRIFEALAAGASGYLVKNTPPAKLLEAIEDIAKGGSPMSSHIARKVVQAFQPAHPSPLIEQLTPREQEVLELLTKGRAYKQICVEMNLSMGTIRTYIRRVYEKLHVNCRTDAVVKYLNATSFERRPIPRG